jgi:rhodanese-related sulfurtransferase
MKLPRNALQQAIVLAIAASIVAFTHNAYNRNGINPFRRPLRVPVVHGSVVDSLHAEAIRVVDLEEARLFVESGGRIVDARTKEFYEEGHIPGAILFDYYQLGTYCDLVLPLLAQDELIMVYCSDYSCEDSELLAKELYSFGYRRLLLYKGGFAEWRAADLPVERGE